MLTLTDDFEQFKSSIPGLRGLTLGASFSTVLSLTRNLEKAVLQQVFGEVPFLGDFDTGAFKNSENLNQDIKSRKKVVIHILIVQLEKFLLLEKFDQESHDGFEVDFFAN